MIIKYEKITDVEKAGEISKDIQVVDQKDATHIHKCRHDEDPQGPCSREEI